MPCFLYARKSTEAEDRQVLSIEAQIKEMREVAKRWNLRIVETLTESKSSKEPGRPVFNTMMKRLYKNEARGVLSWKLDRLARNPIDGASIIWAMKQHGLKIFTPAQTYSHEDENTILMYIEFGMAQKYIDDLSKNVKRGMRMKLEKGGWPAMAPIGYLNDPLKKTIIRDPDRFDLIRKVWDIMLSGSYSIERIVKLANDEWGFRTRKWKRMGGGPLTKSAVYKIFTNPFYAGLLRHKQGVHKGTHDVMVNQKEFDRVQELLGRNDRGRNKQHYFPFAGGLIKCGECGGCITAEHKVNRWGSHYVYYHCTKKNKRVACSQPCIEEKHLQEQTLVFLKRLYIPRPLAEWILRYVSHFDEESKLFSEDKLSTLKKALEENQKQVDELNRMRYRGFLNDDEFLKEKAKLLQERVTLESRIERTGNENDGILPMIEKTIHVAERAPEWFKQASPEHKRLIVEAIGSNLFLKDKILLIQAQIPFILLNDVVRQPMAEKSWIEPQNFSFAKTKAASTAAVISSWQGRLNDVRTFWQENLDWVGKIERVWQIFVDRASLDG